MVQLFKVNSVFKKNFYWVFTLSFTLGIHKGAKEHMPLTHGACSFAELD